MSHKSISIIKILRNHPLQDKRNHKVEDKILKEQMVLNVQVLAM
jgi:hypothetical protein